MLWSACTTSASPPVARLALTCGCAASAALSALTSSGSSVSLAPRSAGSGDSAARTPKSASTQICAHAHGAGVRNTPPVSIPCQGLYAVHMQPHGRMGNQAKPLSALASLLAWSSSQRGTPCMPVKCSWRVRRSGVSAGHAEHNPMLTSQTGNTQADGKSSCGGPKRSSHGKSFTNVSFLQAYAPALSAECGRPSATPPSSTACTLTSSV
eukprot:366412-Chlamydomonas_euryale.AAC.2